MDDSWIGFVVVTQTLPLSYSCGSIVQLTVFHVIYKKLDVIMLGIVFFNTGIGQVYTYFCNIAHSALIEIVSASAYHPY